MNHEHDKQDFDKNDSCECETNKREVKQNKARTNIRTNTILKVNITPYTLKCQILLCTGKRDLLMN